MESGDPFQLIDVLINHKVPCVVIGGHAVTFHGHVSATEVTDVVFRRSAESETALFSALCEVNARWISNEIDPETGIERTVPVSPSYIAATPMMMLTTDCGFLDVFDSIPGYPDAAVDELFDSAVEVDGRKFVSLAWLRKMKSASGRPRDRIDLENLPKGT